MKTNVGRVPKRMLTKLSANISHLNHKKRHVYVATTLHEYRKHRYMSPNFDQTNIFNRKSPNLSRGTPKLSLPT